MQKMDQTVHERRSAFLPVISERNHILLVVALSFLLGTLSLFHLTAGMWLWAVFALGILGGVLLKRAGRSAGAALFLCCFALGALYANAAFETAAPQPGSYRIEATVHGGATPRSDSRVSFVLTDLTLDGVPASGKAYCTLHYDGTPPELFDGARVALDGRAYSPGGKTGAPHFDFRLWMRQQGLDFCIAAYQGVEVLNTPESAPVSDWAFRVREGCRHALERVMGAESRVAMALLLSERGGLSDEEYAGFQTLGIAHIMSVSGLHVALLGGLALRLLERLRMSRRAQLLCLLPFLAFYCGVTGFSAAANRAAVTLLLSLLAHLWLRKPDRVILLSAALLAVLLLNPLHAHSAGFVLSFSAMIGITLYAQPLEAWLDRLWPSVTDGRPKTRLRRLAGRLQRGVKSTFVVSATAQLGVALPTAYYFYQLPLYGLAINMLIVPYASVLLVPLYALCLPLSFVPVLGRAAGLAASTATRALLWMVQLLSALPHAAVRVAAPPLVLAVGLGLALVLLSRRMPGPLRRRALAAVLVVCVACFGAWAQRPAELRYIQLSVGQADSALLLDGNKTVLIDTGVDGSAALDYLLHENRDVDALILTHLHTDHAGGVQALLESGVRIHQVYLPVRAETQRIDPSMAEMLALLQAQNIPVTALACGDKLRYNKAGIEVLWPERETVRPGQDANHYSLVLSIDLDGYLLLQTSDLTGAYETYAAAPADVLKVAHHGSAASTGDAFLDFVSPAAALLTVSSGSRHHPSPATLERLEERGIDVLRTDECGDITLSVQDGRLIITPYL